jgi:hypothetical protein
MEEYEKYGDIARLDVALVSVSGIMLVTYYDSRSVARLLVEMPGRAELSPGQPHDFRAVKVSMKSVGEKLESVGSFSAFGEVANCSVEDGDVVVEFFDMRAAQCLLAAVGQCGAPWTTVSQKPAPLAPPQSLAAPMVSAPLQAPRSQAAPTNPMATSTLLMSSLNALATMEPTPEASSDLNFNFNMAALAQALQEVTELAQTAPAPVEDTSPQSTQEAPTSPQQNNAKVVRTKVTNKEFSMYDIDIEKIQSGDDQRTTVMVRNLTGPSARQDFLNFLAICGLSERYTFFYMPYKEHRNVLAGFAFVNLVAPKDVQVLHAMVKEDVWRKIYRNPSAKVPAVSYARFQGHEQLVKHFSSSAVLHEQDPEKRPIFRPFAGQTQDGAKPKKAAQKASRVPESTTQQPAFLPLPQKVALGTYQALLSDAIAYSKLGSDNVDDPLNGSGAGA